MGSELQHSKFSIQLDESTFSSSNILMAYVRYNGMSIKCIIDEFLFAKYFRADSKGETILPYLGIVLMIRTLPDLTQAFRFTHSNTLLDEDTTVAAAGTATTGSSSVNHQHEVHHASYRMLSLIRL